MIVTIGNTKGGVGKTTLSVNIAVARAISGKDIWLIDGDRQGSAQAAITLRSESGQIPGIACSSFTKGPVLRSQLIQQRQKFDDIIIDVGGQDSSTLRAALVLTDVLVVPFQPRNFDVWALNDIAELVEEARGIRDGLRAYAVLNCADPGPSSLDNSEAAEAVSSVTQFEYLPCPVRRRKAFANAAGSGMSVLEIFPKDPKAINELYSLINVIFNHKSIN